MTTLDGALARVPLAGPLVGAGIDLVARGRVSQLVARGKFSDAEVVAFAECLELPFAAREAVLKAVGGPGVLGAPLREMVFTWDAGRLRFVPGPAYQRILDERGVAALHVVSIAAREDHVMVCAFASGQGEPTTIASAWALVPVDGAGADELTEAERTFARARPQPLPSIATRRAARHALSLLAIEGAEVVGGGDTPPRLTGTAAHLSLSHEREVACALVALPALPVSAAPG